MPDTFVGQTTPILQRVEVQGLPVTDATVTLTLTAPGTGTALVTNGSMPHVGDGWYQYVATASQISVAGAYRRHVVAVTGGVTLPYDALLWAGYPQGPLLARWELRHRIARAARDLWLGQAADNSTSVTPGVELHDPDRIEPDNALRGYYAYCYAGTGMLQERRVRSNDEATGLLTLGKAWTVTPASDTLYELHRTWSVADYNDAINAAITRMSRFVLFDVADESVLETATGTEYAIPPGLAFIHRVEGYDSTGDRWRVLDRTRTPAPYRVIPGRRLLQVACPVTDRRLRLWGQALPQPLAHDQQWVDYGTEYLEAAAGERLELSRVTSPGNDTRNAAQRLAFHKATMERLEPLLERKPYPNSWAV